jgi:hypothetical protein
MNRTRFFRLEIQLKGLIVDLNFWKIFEGTQGSIESGA